MAEITKASKHEACTLPNKAESFWKDVNFNILNSEKETGKISTSTSYVDNTKDIDYMELGEYPTTVWCLLDIALIPQWWFLI